MRASAIALVCSLLGIVLGAVLIGRWAVGCAVIFDSLCVGWWALERDDGEAGEPQVRGPLTLPQVFERARNAP